MGSTVPLEWLFAILILIVFTNRYIFGSFLRLADPRTQAGYDRDPPVWPSVAIIVPVFNEGPARHPDGGLFRADGLSAREALRHLCGRLLDRRYLRAFAGGQEAAPLD